ncbi:MAG: hypothetical protein KH231_06380 [Dialister sp.]|uniref:hypothetical protein n=1 Tax=Dialister sp. TaxID=1955814 RepID=UPI001D46B664|nr:hypothetical protein [Dialister sp.]MBS6715084.1 hypothetical protein [Dialister sp.]
MAILNNSGVHISFDCEDMIEDLRDDLDDFDKAHKVYACCRLDQGVKIIYDYTYDLNDEPKPVMAEGDWTEETTIGELLSYCIMQNNVLDYCDNILDLFDEMNWSVKEFSDYFSLPDDLLKRWLYGTEKCPEYVLHLMNDKLIADNKVPR